MVNGIGAAGLASTLGLVAGVTAAAAQNEDRGKFEKGSRVIIQGCVQEAETADAYVLTHLHEWPIGNTSLGKYGPRSYWVDQHVDEFRSRVGQTIQMTAEIVGMQRSEIEMEPGFHTGGTVVEIERPDVNVATNPEGAGLPPGRSSNTTDQKITLLKLKVSSFLTVLKTCLPDPASPRKPVGEFDGK